MRGSRMPLIIEEQVYNHERLTYAMSCSQILQRAPAAPRLQV